MISALLSRITHQKLPRNFFNRELKGLLKLTPRRTVPRGTGIKTIRLRRFRKHRGPCGQPAVVGEIGCLRPVPSQAEHGTRINATPSDLPFKSTGFATYPVPLQLGHSCGSTPLPPH